MDLTSYIASMSVSMAQANVAQSVKEHRQHRAKRGRGG